MDNSKALERLFWSIAFPGFAQFLNGKIVKGIVLITLEFLINFMSKLNNAIVSSFQGDIIEAINSVDFQWLLFYPCVYIFAIWDGYKDAGGGRTPFSFFPFVFSAYLGTIGVIYSSNLKLFGAIIGPVFLPIIFLIIGAIIGFVIQLSLISLYKIKKQDAS